MNTHITHRKIRYYTPGLISLILFPLLCIGFLNKHHVFDKVVTKQLVVPDSHIHSYTNTPTLNSIIHTRHFTEFKLTGDANNDELQLQQGQLAIRKVLIDGDTAQGVHFKIANTTKYQSVIDLLDICKLENAKVYALNNNDFWVVVYQPEPIVKLHQFTPSFCGTQEQRELHLEQFYEESLKSQHIPTPIKSFWLSMLLFMLMAVLSAIQVRKTWI